MECYSASFTWLAAAAVASAALGTHSPGHRPVGVAAQSSAPTLRNVRLAHGGTPFQVPPGPGPSFLVTEAGQGGLDLNGDGDAGDHVLHVIPQSASPVLGVGLASFKFGPQFAGRTVALGVLEILQGGQDLNGDGDAIDNVLHLVHATSGAVTNTGLNLNPSMPWQHSLRASATFTALAVSEAGQGGQDLNGDGDASDGVLHHVATVNGAVTNVGVAVSWLDIAADLIVGGVDEVAQGQDLNGDGILAGFTPCVVDAAQSTLAVLPSAHNQFVRASAGHVAYPSSEAAAGTDLNGDGDLADVVLQILHVASTTTQNAGIAVQNLLTCDGPSLALLVDESAQGQDLNGDGDLLDGIAHVVHLPTASVFNTGLAAVVQLGLRGRSLSLLVAEALQGGQDLNGDGDALDSVLHVVDVANGVATNLGLQATQFATGGRLIGFQVRELEQGGQDLNGDGDTNDLVWHVHDVALGTTTDLGLATPYPSSSGLAGDGYLVLTADEASAGAQDLNGDGDAVDTVVHLVCPGQPAVSLGVAVVPLEPGWLSGRRVFLSVDEAAQAQTDLNGDGDAMDRVVHVLDVP